MAGAHKTKVNGKPNSDTRSLAPARPPDLQSSAPIQQAANETVDEERDRTVPRATAQRLMRTRQAAKYLGLSTWALRNLVQHGEIPVIPQQGHAPWLVDVRDLDSWIERNKRTLAL
jgi:excisionase family DNA binding protein